MLLFLLLDDNVTLCVAKFVTLIRSKTVVLPEPCTPTINKLICCGLKYSAYKPDTKLNMMYLLVDIKYCAVPFTFSTMDEYLNDSAKSDSQKQDMHRRCNHKGLPK